MSSLLVLIVATCPARQSQLFDLCSIVIADHGMHAEIDLLQIDFHLERPKKIFFAMHFSPRENNPISSFVKWRGIPSAQITS